MFCLLATITGPGVCVHVCSRQHAGGPSGSGMRLSQQQHHHHHHHTSKASSSSSRLPGGSAAWLPAHPGPPHTRPPAGREWRRTQMRGSGKQTRAKPGWGPDNIAWLPLQRQVDCCTLLRPIPQPSTPTTCLHRLLLSRLGQLQPRDLGGLAIRARLIQHLPAGAGKNHPWVAHSVQVHCLPTCLPANTGDPSKRQPWCTSPPHLQPQRVWMRPPLAWM